MRNPLSLKTLTRYILKEHIGPFLFAITLLTLIFLLNILFRDLGRMLSRGVHILTFLELLGLNLAWIFALSFPMGVLVSTLFTFGKFSAENEITAIKASGISFLQLLKPVLIAGILLAAGLIVYNNTILPEFNHRARLLSEDIYRKIPTIKIEPNVVFTDIPDINLFTKKIIDQDSSSRLETIIIDDLTNPNKRKTILAQWGILQFDKEADRLIMDLYDGEIHEVDYNNLSDYRRGTFNRHRLSIDIPGLSLKRSSSSYRGDREKSTQMMERDIKKHRESIATRNERIATLIEQQFVNELPLDLFQNLNGPITPSNSDVYIYDKTNTDLFKIVKTRLKNSRNQIKQEKRLIRSYSRNISSLQVEIHKKYSIPVACIIFIFVGAPLGIVTKKGNMGVAVAISMLFFLMFWVGLIQGEILADRQIVSPAFAMWSADIIMGIIGLVLVVFTVGEVNPLRIRKLKRKYPEETIKDSTLLSSDLVSKKFVESSKKPEQVDSMQDKQIEIKEDINDEGSPSHDSDSVFLKRIQAAKGLDLKLLYDVFEDIAHPLSLEDRFYFYELLEEMKKYEPHYPEKLKREFLNFCQRH
ncbi:LptF/LptG family permease [candidate division KSB1 bacterium]|nr:LptF/LptG family permease [candidate division KSB1 bacterium]